MFGHDPQRTGWAWEETAFTQQNIAGLELKWKTQLRNEPKFLHALTAPVVATDVVTPEGTKTLVYVAGSSNGIYALNADNGSLVWSRTFASRVLPGAGPYQGTFLCPNGITATQFVTEGADEIQHINFIFLNFFADKVKDTRTPERFTSLPWMEGCLGWS